MIKFKDVSFSYGENKVIKKINIEINRGEFICVIGQNGSGKSTFAKLTNALLVPEEGSVEIDGISSFDEKNRFKIRQKVGMVFQNPDNQIVASIVEDDIAFGPENIRLPREEIIKRVDDSLKIVGLQDKRKMPTYSLSGGQKQKLAVAGVLALGSDAIVLDESTSMLDPKGRKDLISLMLELNKKGKTIILITHHMEEALSADRIICFENGEIVVDRAPLEVFYDSAFCESQSIVVPKIVKLSSKFALRASTNSELVELLCH